MKHVRIEGSHKLSSFVEPTKAQLTDQPPFDSVDWIFEIKWDGYRAIAEINKSGNRLYWKQESRKKVSLLLNHVTYIADSNFC